MKGIFALFCLLALFLFFGKTLLEAQKWVILFDGKNLNHWRSQISEIPPKNWQIEGNTLKFIPSSPAYNKDILTKKTFKDFELRLEWKVSRGGNSGVFFRIDKKLQSPIYESGLEMQILDNKNHPNGKYPITSAGACYGLYIPKKPIVKPFGEWNKVRILAINSRIQLFLNGGEVVSFDVKSHDFKNRIAKSKFRNLENFGKFAEGHIALQDHHDVIWFRNIKIRER